MKKKSIRDTPVIVIPKGYTIIEQIIKSKIPFICQPYTKIGYSEFV